MMKIVRDLAHKNPVDALDRLEVWLLPWMKPGLESFRFGYEWSERFEAREFVDPIDDREAVAGIPSIRVVRADHDR